MCISVYLTTTISIVRTGKEGKTNGIMCYLITIVYCRDWERVKGNRINVYFRIGKERKTIRLSVSHHHSQELGKRESK